MRNFKIILLLIMVPLFFIAPACEKAVEDPLACYKLSIKKEGEVLVLTEPYTVDAGRSIQFENCGKADFYSFFSGTPGNVWADFNNPSDTETVGVDTKSDGSIDYTYSTPGQYTATMVLTNREVKNASNYRQVALDFVITVTEAEE
jgi:hypothetical protein